MSDSPKRETICRLCKVELMRRELPRVGEAGYCDRCLRAHQTRPVSFGASS